MNIKEEIEELYVSHTDAGGDIIDSEEFISDLVDLFEKFKERKE